MARTFQRLAPRIRGGFTLIEVLLSTVILLFLLSAVVVSFSSLREGAVLNEGAERFETLLRLARAHAANTGQRVRIEFQEDEADPNAAAMASVRVARETDPFQAPGEFVRLRGGEWNLRGINELIGVEAVEPLTVPSPAVEERDKAGEGSEAGPVITFPEIVFYPDGSSDSARVILASREPGDLRRAVVRLVGITGDIRREVLLSEKELEERELEEAMKKEEKQNQGFDRAAESEEGFGGGGAKDPDLGEEDLLPR